MDRRGLSRRTRGRVERKSRDGTAPKRVLRRAKLIAGAVLLGLAFFVALKLWILFHMLLAHVS